MEDKNAYFSPEFEVIEVTEEDFICTSPGGGDSEDPNWNPEL